MNATNIRLADFGADQLFIVSVGEPLGYALDLTDTDGTALNDYEIEHGISSPWDLEGVAKDGVWTWDGVGNPRDYNGNTVTGIRAYLPDEA